MLEGKDLVKRYGSREVLAPVTLRLEKGQCLGLIGSNGSGKSTLISILAQTLKPDGGKILADGRSVMGNRRFLRDKLGYLPQQPALVEELKVNEQLRLWQKSRGMKKGLTPELAELLGLYELADRRIGQLSGGQKRRVSLALALMGEPEYLLMDEAFNALDVGYRILLLDWMKGFCARGGAVLWCSHDREELLTLCPNCLGLDQGKIIAQGPTAEVLEVMKGVML